MRWLAWRRWAPGLGAAFVTVVLAVACRTSPSDVQRWGNTKQGPRKLVAVLTHDKYLLDLRVEAAKTLIEMKPRNGRRVGIVGEDGDPDNRGLIHAIARLPREERSAIVERLVPVIVTELRRPVPTVPAGQPASIDPSIPYKDTAFALLTHENAQLVEDPAHRGALEQALAGWCAADFARRVDDPSQLFGVEQVLKSLKAEGARRLPPLLVPEGKKIDLLASLIADLGDERTKLDASRRLVRIAADVADAGWKQRKGPLVRSINEASRLKPTREQFEAQLDQYQEEELLRVFSSMKRVAGAPTVEYLLDFAGDRHRPEKRRAAALAALEGNIVKCAAADCDQRTLDQIDAVLAIARSDDAPDSVRDQALRRVGEMPRKLVVDRLYSLFGEKKWKIRWMAADLVLSMSDADQVGEVLANLRDATKELAIAEPLQYGYRLGTLKGKTTPGAIAAAQVAADQPVISRVTALGYYFHHGTRSDLPLLAGLEGDPMKVPKTPDCEGNDRGCAWECEVVEGGAHIVKEVATIGQFVKFCVEPAVAARDATPGRSEPQEKR